MTRSKIKFPIVERDVSWMYFNHRILQEAQRETVPLLERLSFLGIYSNNLDEFFRVRVAALSRISESRNKNLAKEAEKAHHVLKEINHLNSEYVKEFAEATSCVMDALKKVDIHVIKDTEANDKQRQFVRQFFFERINGTTLPVWFSAIDRLVSEEDDAIYLAVKMTSRQGFRPQKNYALLKIPVQKLGRFLRLPDKDGKSYLMWMDDVVRLCLPWIFAGANYDHFEAYAFKFTKDAEMEIDDNMEQSKLQKVQKGVKSRKHGEPLRVLYDAEMPKDLRRILRSKLDLDKLDTTLASGRYHNHKDLMSFPDCGRKELKFPAQSSIQLPQFTGMESLFDVIRREDQFIHVPYHSFDAYLRFLREAAINPAVKSIKTTLYRLAKDSKVVENLITAAKNKKKVTVVIELLARFDEASNIQWSSKLRDAGVNVIYGVEGLKIHSKITHVETRYGDYAVIGTGNFHEGNARVYTDCMLFTASKPIVRDVEKVFKFISSPFIPVKFRELLVSPNEMKTKLLKLINTELQNHHLGKPAYIRMKTNHITDPDTVEALYKASSEGVPVDILCRGNCALVPGVKSISETMHIKGIIDRYLEHSRILLFCNGGDEKCFIGSADWMPRNLENRIEVMTPIYNERIKAEMRFIVNAGLKDNCQARIVDGKGGNKIEIECVHEGSDSPMERYRSQEELYKHYLSQIEN